MTTRRTIRHLLLAFLFVSLVTVPAAAGVAVAQDDDATDTTVSRLCMRFGDPNGHPYIDAQCAAAVRAATEEAAGWPEFDSLAIGDQIEMARREAAGWPSYDPSSLAGSVAQTEAAKAAAAEEAAGWPNFDSTALGRQAQIAQAGAEESADSQRFQD